MTTSIKVEVFGIELEKRSEFERFLRSATEKLREARGAEIAYARVRLTPEGTFFGRPSAFSCAFVLLFEREGPILARATGPSPFDAAYRALREIRAQLEETDSLGSPSLRKQREVFFERPIPDSG